jgi:hypothetical protein
VVPPQDLLFLRADLEWAREKAALKKIRDDFGRAAAVDLG